MTTYYEITVFCETPCKECGGYRRFKKNGKCTSCVRSDASKRAAQTAWREQSKDPCAKIRPLACHDDVMARVRYEDANIRGELL